MQLVKHSTTIGRSSTSVMCPNSVAYINKRIHLYDCLTNWYSDLIGGRAAATLLAAGSTTATGSSGAAHKNHSSAGTAARFCLRGLPKAANATWIAIAAPAAATAGSSCWFDHPNWSAAQCWELWEASNRHQWLATSRVLQTGSGQYHGSTATAAGAEQLTAPPLQRFKWRTSERPDAQGGDASQAGGT